MNTRDLPETRVSADKFSGWVYTLSCDTDIGGRRVDRFGVESTGFLQNTRLLYQFVSPHTGYIYGRHITGLCVFMQMHVALNIKRSRMAGELIDGLFFIHPTGVRCLCSKKSSSERSSPTQPVSTNSSTPSKVLNHTDHCWSHHYFSSANGRS